jgi:hypothetical protein
VLHEKLDVARTKVDYFPIDFPERGGISQDREMSIFIIQIGTIVIVILRDLHCNHVMSLYVMEDIPKNLDLIGEMFEYLHCSKK